MFYIGKAGFAVLMLLFGFLPSSQLIGITLYTRAEAVQQAQIKILEDDSKSENFENVEEYTVVKDDTYWKIAMKVYGDGSQYKKILDANNLEQDTLLEVGQKLKIPK